MVVTLQQKPDECTGRDTPGAYSRQKGVPLEEASLERSACFARAYVHAPLPPALATPDLLSSHGIHEASGVQQGQKMDHWDLQYALPDLSGPCVCYHVTC